MQNLFKYNIKKVDPGLTVAAYDKGLWYRAEVINVIGSEALVSFVDFGHKKVLNVDSLRYLDKSFAELARMAYKGSLFGVKPKDGNLWNAKSIMDFMGITKEKDLWASIKAHKEEVFHLSIVFDLRLRLRVANFLISEGHAENDFNVDNSSFAVLVKTSLNSTLNF